MPIVGEETLLQQTLTRLPAGADEPIVICNEDHRFMVAQQLQEIGRTATIILEPVGRNTAPAIAVGALAALARDRDAVVLAAPSDHFIADAAAFHAAIAAAGAAAATGALVTFGITPDHPSTAYGYIEEGPALDGCDGVCRVERFVEKPDAETAAGYLAAKNFYWNSGIFLFRAEAFLQELGRQRPEIVEAARAAFDGAAPDLDFLRLERESFEKSPSDSIDYAVMEKTANAAVVPVSMGWNDVGSWTTLFDIEEADGDGNVTHGDVVAIDTANSYIRSDGRLIGVIGLEDVIIVDTEDALLIADRGRAQEVRALVERISAEGREESNLHVTVQRPWGSYRGIDRGQRFQVKQIEVKPGASLSLQMHHHRAEHWIVVEGTAKVTRGDEVFLIEENQSTYIPIGTRHRLENPGMIPLKLIEVQSGSYLGEDDIVRFEDIYGRDEE
jgi:mannose-1-phosphate guanylyltransferase/mannose-6-phosphate isomerase